MSLNDSVLRAARAVAKEALAIEPNEEVVIIVEEDRLDIASAMVTATVELGAQPTILPISSTLREAYKAVDKKMALTDAMKAALSEADVIITAIEPVVGEVKFRLSIINYRNTNPCRIAHMPGITIKHFAAYCDTNYDFLEENGNKLVQKLKGNIGSTMHIVTEKGTDLTLTISDLIHFSSGRLNMPGDFGNLPAGEVYFAPVKGSAEGTLVIDGSVPNEILEKQQDYITIQLINGEVVGAIDDPKNLIQNSLSLPGGSVLCEVGFGLNDKIVEPTGIELIDEKATQTVHFGFGDNTFFGGDNVSEIHIDLISKSPTVKINLKEIMHEGVIVKS